MLLHQRVQQLRPLEPLAVDQRAAVRAVPQLDLYRVAKADIAEGHVPGTLRLVLSESTVDPHLAADPGPI